MFIIGRNKNVCKEETNYYNIYLRIFEFIVKRKSILCFLKVEQQARRVEPVPALWLWCGAGEVVLSSAAEMEEDRQKSREKMVCVFFRLELRILR